jgi:dimethylhistidine N-methyltransferase
MTALHFYDLPIESTESLGQVIAELTQPQKTISPKYFYDERGSELFMEITRQPEYYLTRTEVTLLRRYASEMTEAIGEDCLLIEYGSGSSEKIRILLDSLKPRAYAPLDISRDYLAAAAGSLAAEFPWLEVHATCLDYTREFELPFSVEARHVAFFPGSSIGNFNRTEALDFLRRARGLVGQGGGMLIGVDLKKDEGILNAAYNDAGGVTQEFNLNMLSHFNTLFDADFDPTEFTHLAQYEAENGCVAMYLTSRSEQTVNVSSTSIRLARGERIHTENSHKYANDEFLRMATQAGFSHHRFWTDDAGWFGIFFLY